MASSEQSPPGNLVVRPVIEEFKAHAQERIAQFERAKKVEALRVFLDAAELGVQVLLETLLESAGEDSLPEASLRGPGMLGGRQEAEEEPGVETEYLDAQEEPEARAKTGQWNLPRAEEVLSGEESAEPGHHVEDPHASETAAKPEAGTRTDATTDETKDGEKAAGGEGKKEGEGGKE